MVGRVLLQVPASLLYCAMPHWAILGDIARWSPPLRSLLFSSPTVASSTATPR